LPLKVIVELLSREALDSCHTNRQKNINYIWISGPYPRFW
jgi:hypothetical protein